MRTSLAVSLILMVVATSVAFMTGRRLTRSGHYESIIFNLTDPYKEVHLINWTFDKAYLTPTAVGA